VVTVTYFKVAVPQLPRHPEESHENCHWG